MFGFEDPWVSLVYGLCLASSLLCVVYGAINWNKGEEPAAPEDAVWAAEEDKLKEEI